VARNRKRAKERRARRPQPVASRRDGRDERDEAPSPLGHAAPDVELADAQMAMGRPDGVRDDERDFADVERAEEAAAEEEAATEEDAATEEEDEEFGEAPEIPGVTPGRLQVRSGELTRAEAAPVSEPRARPGNRLINFLQGSWRELQRVQWPDRRQVVQATGVVIGFVIVAGVFLGVADFLASKLMTFILK
jgi:preprotein translocase SecE subunit